MIVCRYVHKRRQFKSPHQSGYEFCYFVISDNPKRYEMVPVQHYYGETDWKEYPSVWVESAWSRTKTFQASKTGVFLPESEVKWGQEGVLWFMFTFNPQCAVSRHYAHKKQTHKRLLREFSALLMERRLDQS